MFRKALINDDGFTLLEVLVAIVILATALLSMAGIMSTNIKTVSRGKHQTIATNLAIEQMESLQMQANADFDAVAVADTVAASDPVTRANPDITEDYGTITNYPTFRRETYITDGAVPVNSKDVGVVLLWTDVSGAHNIVMRSTFAR